MSDTPISDSTPHNVAELGMLCRRLERELHAANERIKLLEDIIKRSGYEFFKDGSDSRIAVNMLTVLDEARDAKP